MHARNAYDVPDAPDAPDIIDYDEQRIDIAWKPPASDGGAPIKEYIVEKREKGSPTWIEVREWGSYSPAEVFREQIHYEFFRIIIIIDIGIIKQ